MTITLPVAGVTVNAPALILFGLIIGYLAGMFGVGGGFLITPMLRIVFGIPYNVAVGSGLLQILGTSVFSAYRHLKLGNVNLKLGAIMGLSAIMGTEIGVRLQCLLKDSGTLVINNHQISAQDFWMTVIFIALLLFIGVSMLRDTVSKQGGNGTSQQHADSPSFIESLIKSIRIPPFVENDISLWATIILGVTVGILTGILGVGGGFINFPVLIYILGLPAIKAAGTSSFQILFSSSYGAIRHAAEANIDLLLVAMMLIGSVAGSQLGAFTSRKLADKSLRKYFAIVVLVVVVIMICDSLLKILA